MSILSFQTLEIEIKLMNLNYFDEMITITNPSFWGESYFGLKSMRLKILSVLVWVCYIIGETRLVSCCN